MWKNMRDVEMNTGGAGNSTAWDSSNLPRSHRGGMTRGTESLACQLHPLPLI